MVRVSCSVSVVVVLVMVNAVQPFIVIQPPLTPTTTATATTTTPTTLGTLGTLTLGSTGLGTGLASLGVLGALKLGVIAVAAKLAAIAGFALAKKFHYREPAQEYNSYSHHYVPHVYNTGYGGYGGGGGYGGSHYHKRSLRGMEEEDVEEKEDVASSIVLSEEEAFTLVHESDESRCGERLVCELARKSRYGLLSDEESLLSLIKQKPTGNYGSGSSRNLYLNAMKSGYRRKHCQMLYPSCPFNSHQIMALVRSMGRDLLNDPVSFIASTPDQQTLHPGKDLTKETKHQGSKSKYQGIQPRNQENQPRNRGSPSNQESQNKTWKKSSKMAKKRHTKSPKYDVIGYRKS